jgi:hypothetical protein
MTFDFERIKHPGVGMENQGQNYGERRILHDEEDEQKDLS